ncbi:RtcB family protein [Desulfonema ishimotonii]|uniref:tRNA-splicing ligase RtcB n=1 Tax=Desulfonema ishimotonii TaxID=45657 RepID=A0A401G1E3_9BACT|nr:RtcB family protein [Desulfonema ishimotonii]GBC63026.1 RtcB family protein [Desulfonema ishimotonii]
MNKEVFQDKRLNRINEYSLSLSNDWNIPVKFCANRQILLEEEGVKELSVLLQTQRTIEKILNRKPDFFGKNRMPEIREVVLTPDFHKGKGIPVGTVILSKDFVIPQATGNDINCGMRLLSTSYTSDQILPHLDDIENRLRYIFFQGGRNLPMAPEQRQALLKYGISGLIDTCGITKNEGLWRYFDAEREFSNLGHIHGRGSYPADDIFALKDYIDNSRGISHDSVIGTLGGGNHFAEIQYVRKIHDSQTAYQWGINEGGVVIMIHSGSLGIGQMTGHYFQKILKDIYPKDIGYPENGIFVLPVHGELSKYYGRFKTSMYNAANFAFGNRLFLSLMVMNALDSVLGESDMKLIYDAPHNLIWEEITGELYEYIHRKGATPAYGYEVMNDSEFAYYGEPVIVPGSMGAPSYLLRGNGERAFLYSASHGAGRQLSRGAAMKISDRNLDEFLNSFRIVTPVNMKDHQIKKRPDIMKKIRDSIKQEAPFAYKDITPVIKTLTESDVAYPVAEFYPLLTVKS